MKRLPGLVVCLVIPVVLGLIRTLDWPHALLLAGCAMSLTLIWPPFLPDPPRLTPLPYHTHLGARTDLSDLSWTAIDRDGAISARAHDRVAQLATTTGLDDLRRTIDATPTPSPAQVRAWLGTIHTAQGD